MIDPVYGVIPVAGAGTAALIIDDMAETQYEDTLSALEDLKESGKLREDEVRRELGDRSLENYLNDDFRHRLARRKDKYTQPATYGTKKALVDFVEGLNDFQNGFLFGESPEQALEP